MENHLIVPEEPETTEKPMECSDVDEESEEIDVQGTVRICLVGNSANDATVKDAALTFNVPVEVSEDGSEYISSPPYSTVFVLEEFSGPVFDSLRERGHRILGVTALKEIASNKGPLPETTRPLYCLSMKGVILCFTGFRVKEEVNRLVQLVHFMGGSVRKEMISKVTHLVANCCGGQKYQYAVNFRLPVMSVEWIHNAWAMRAQIGFNAHQNGLAEYKLKPFHGARVCFLGFPEEEKRHMADILVENGGVHTDIEDPACTHVVLDSAETFDMFRKEGTLSGKRKRCDSPSSSPPNLDISYSSLVNPPAPSSSKSHVNLDRSLADGCENDQPCTPSVNNNFELDSSPLSSKKFRGSSPKRAKRHSFKTPTRLNIVRRSIRQKTSSVLNKWISSLDVTLGNKHETPSLQNSLSSKLDVHSSPDAKEEPCMNNLVVDESTTSTAPSQVPSKAFMVKAEWFWASVQNEVCVIEDYHSFQECVGRVTPRLSINSTPGSIRARKRKRFRQNNRGLANVSTSSVSPQLEQVKRRSSVSDATLLSCSGSYLESSPHPDFEEAASEVVESPKQKLSARHQVFLELLQTESNYVGILNTIMSLFKEPLEDMLDSDDQLLNATELKIIFGNLPPIHQAHCHMLEELRQASQKWSEDVSIGSIFLKFAPDFVKAYPPFVNFFENTVDMLVKCDESKPRFHAFLKARQTRAECGRQSLQELLIRPVQRLPSISLLLSDILKHTSKSNPDYSALERALSAIREVMTHINEDKRKTEGQLAIFDIFREIDNCPPDLISSHRSFIARCDVVELSDGISGRGDPLVFFLFNDVVEICKKRSKAFNSIRSPAPAPGKQSYGKAYYKHIKLMPLSTIKKVLDIRETDDCHKVFALMCRSTQDLKEKFYSFTIIDDEVDKMTFLKTLCRHTANNACRADAENFLGTLDPEMLDIDTSDVGTGTLGKAFKFASKTRLGRALSFNKTPSKLKRAMSTMMSPFGSTTNLTPASQLAQMRLASCTNINELANGSPTAPQYVAPLSVQPTRRAKHSSMSVASLRRL